MLLIFRHHLKSVLLSFVVLIILGYFSDWVSARSCEKRVARWVASGIYQGRQFFILKPNPNDPSPTSNESLQIFKSVGAKACEYIQTTQEFNGFPWGDIHRAQIRYPFVVSVRWGYVAAPLSGTGGTRLFFCLFGFVIPVVDLGGWVT